jgi:hypothetical protein
VDLAKIAIFVAAFVLLLLIGRLLARVGEVHASELPPPQPGVDPVVAGANAPLSYVSEKRPAQSLTGAEVGLPSQITPVKRLDDGGFNRPYVSNYYFQKTDLVQGPADPACFCDDLYLLLQDPESQQRWYNKYTVATPAGLRQLMDQQKFESVYLDSDVVIVSRWDLGVILHTVIDELEQTYGKHKEEGEILTEPRQTREQA